MTHLGLAVRLTGQRTATDAPAEIGHIRKDALDRLEVQWIATSRLIPDTVGVHPADPAFVHLWPEEREHQPILIPPPRDGRRRGMGKRREPPEDVIDHQSRMWLVLQQMHKRGAMPVVVHEIAPRDRPARIAAAHRCTVQGRQHATDDMVLNVEPAVLASHAELLAVELAAEIVDAAPADDPARMLRNVADELIMLILPFVAEQPVLLADQ